MSYRGRLLACAGLSLVAHLALERGARLLPERQAARPRPAPVVVRIVEPPAPPEPDPPPEPIAAETPPLEVPEAKVVPKPRAPKRPADQPVEAPPTSEPPAPASSAPPKFGVTMESTSQGGSGPAMPTGSSAAPPRASGDPAGRAGADRGTGSGPAAPVEAYEVSVMPLPRGRCSGRYTEAARQAAIEGTVVLDLVVGADGKTRDIAVVSGLSHGLSEAAVAALRACRFTPGERAGTPVPVKLRGFKIRFFLAEN